MAVLGGRGKSFCAGADRKEGPTAAANDREARYINQLGRRAARAIEDCEAVTMRESWSAPTCQPCRSSLAVSRVRAGFERSGCQAGRTQVPDHRLESERIVVQAPMSFIGSAARIWRLARVGPLPISLLLGFLAVLLIAVVWLFVLCWYLLFGLLLVPYRLVRRGSRTRKREGLRHSEVLDAIENHDGKSVAKDSNVPAT
ncbi:hypothetical protein [Candidatus Poriferisodalis sp.]|uniref:hypothetical protein n=1 Tax=Candidatus Poriferisodalis sp. TaxID=3101277 RepID=UPI003B015BCA